MKAHHHHNHDYYQVLPPSVNPSLSLCDYIPVWLALLSANRQRGTGPYNICRPNKPPSLSLSLSPCLPPCLACCLPGWLAGLACFQPVVPFGAVASFQEAAWFSLLQHSEEVALLPAAAPAARPGRWSWHTWQRIFPGIWPVCQSWSAGDDHWLVDMAILMWAYQSSIGLIYNIYIST